MLQLFFFISGGLEKDRVRGCANFLLVLARTYVTLNPRSPKPPNPEPLNLKPLKPKPESLFGGGSNLLCRLYPAAPGEGTPTKPLG